ncbi:hypothetical protein [Persephonella sp.]|uniref:hypothetical protein n=1 Tax=Persephonella sp. TaxID=2060922 RepID=UPI0025E6AC0C|nr:hypothetical protein [Persephonella sp.]
MLTFEIEKLLIRLAKEKKTITYSQLASYINKKSLEKLPEKGKALGTVLSKHLHVICEKYVKNGKPMIGSLVVSKKTGMPSEGFFKFAEKLYSIDLKNDDHKRIFWQNELKKVFEEFKD